MNESIKLSRSHVPENGHDAIVERGSNASALTRPNGAYSYDRTDEQTSNLVDYWRTIRKHVWLVIGISVLIPTLVAVYLVRQPDVYEAQARVQVDLENANPLLGGMSKNSSVILSSESNDPAYFNTQLKILT